MLLQATTLVIVIMLMSFYNGVFNKMPNTNLTKNLKRGMDFVAIVSMATLITSILSTVENKYGAIMAIFGVLMLYILLTIKIGGEITIMGRKFKL